MNPESLLLAGCLIACAVSALALLLLGDPDSRLSRRVDRPADDTAHTVGGPR